MICSAASFDNLAVALWVKVAYGVLLFRRVGVLVVLLIGRRLRRGGG